MLERSITMDLANIMYRYINRFSNSEELINALLNIDKSKYPKNEIEEIYKLLEDVKEIVVTIPNEIDEIEEKRIANIDHMLELFKNNLDSDKLDEQGTKFVQKQYNKLLKDKERVRDSRPRYTKLFELLTKHPLIGKYCKQMNDFELLEFITQYISAPLPPNINQEEFNELVDAGIRKDARESLWRLALNYDGKGKDFRKIEDYFILKRDDYYLTELLSAVEKNLDTNKSVEKIMKTKDEVFISNVIKRGIDIGHIFSEEELEKLKNAIKKEDE